MLAAANVDSAEGQRLSASLLAMVLIGVAGLGSLLRWRYSRKLRAALKSGIKLKLRLPVIGPVFRSAALGRFARTLGTLVKSGVSLLPALKIVENTIGNRMLAKAHCSGRRRNSRRRFAGRALAKAWNLSTHRRPNDQRRRRDRQARRNAAESGGNRRAPYACPNQNPDSLLAPALILVVGALVGFMVIALLLPIFKMSTCHALMEGTNENSKH